MNVEGAKLPEESSSSDEDIEMSPPAKSMVDKLRTWMDTRIQERMEAFNENVQFEPLMVQKDDTIQLLLQILNDQNGRMRKLEQAILGHHRMSQGNATRGIEIGQEFGQQPQIEVVATNVEIPIGYPIIPVIGSEERPNNTNPSIPITEPPREEQPRVEKPITEPPRIEQPRAEQTVIEPPRVEPPQFEQPRVEAPRFEQPRVEPPRVEPPRFKQPRMEPSRVKPPQFEQPRMEPPRFKQPRMESPRMGQPQFGFPRMEPFQQGIGDDEKTTIEHISRFTVQCGEYSNNGNGKLRLFPNSLTGQAFTWKPRMIRPPVSEARRWVTLETLGLKPIHRQKYKYGYNPYFSRMTRTLRRRWIRQQAALHQEFERKDHYSSSLTTNSDSMEMITGAEAPEYLKGPCAKKEDTIGAPTKDIATPTMNGVGHKVQSTVAKPCRGKDLEGTRENHKRLEKGSENAESETESEEVKTSHTPMWPQKGQMVQNIGDIEDIEDIENIEDTKDMEDIENIENVEDLEGFGNIEGVENFENIEGIDDIEVEEADDIEEMEGSEAMECTETNIQTRKPKIKEEDVRGATLILLADDEECRDIGIDQNGNTSKVTVGPKEPLTMEDLFKLSQNLEETKTRPKVENGLDYYVENVE
uniref:Uncharacterized protein n=1 Tax=Fagus sylvatica TaxID=28930 RepID=A0A2N9IVJ4_FAGSY